MALRIMTRTARGGAKIDTWVYVLDDKGNNPFLVEVISSSGYCEAGS